MDWEDKTLTEKVSYIKGLADGLKLEDSDQNKVIKALLDLVEDMALTVSDLEDELDSVEEQLDAVDEDLDELECFVYDEYDDCDCCCDDDCDCDCDCCDDDDICYDIECPNCGECFCVDEDTLCDGSVNCPKCNELLTFEIEEDDGEED